MSNSKRQIQVFLLTWLFRLSALLVVISGAIGVYALYALVVSPAVQQKEITLEVHRAYLLKQIELGQYKEGATNGDSGQ